MILNSNKFNLEKHAENIFTYNERLRGLLENQINIGEEKFVSEFIIKYMKSTEIFKDLYGDYDFYNYMNSFIKPLYVSEKVSDARNLYEKIKRIDRVQFTSSLKSDKTNWRVPKYKVHFYKDLMIKYPDEFIDGIKNSINTYTFYKYIIMEPV